MNEFSHPAVQAYCAEHTFTTLAAMLFSSTERVKPENKKLAKVLRKFLSCLFSALLLNI